MAFVTIWLGSTNNRKLYLVLQRKKGGVNPSLSGNLGKTD